MSVCFVRARLPQSLCCYIQALWEGARLIESFQAGCAFWMQSPQQLELVLSETDGSCFSKDTMWAAQKTWRVG
jgi:hypothetical protein